MNDYDPILFTQRQVFGRDTASGTLSTNDDYNEHIRPIGSPKPPAVEYDMLDYLTNGAGRYATPAVFPIIDDFFSSSIPQKPNGQPYNLSEIRSELNLTDNADFREATEISIWQYGTDTTSLDFPERAYIFGTTDFRLDLTNAEFIVTENGNQFIEGMQVIAKEDNFDFRGGAGPINAVANTVLLPAYDPYGLGIDPIDPRNREVPIKFTTSTNGRTYGTSSDLYSHSDWLADDIYEIGTISIKDTVSGAAKLASGISQFLNPVSTTLAGSYLFNINSDPFLRYLRDDSKVIYGTPGNDNLDPSYREIDPLDPQLPSSAFSSNLIVGGAGSDTITSFNRSDELLGGEGNDVLKGGYGNDTLNGGADNDNLDGGEGNRDVAIFTEEYTVENYPYLQNADGTITFANDTDGIDTLKNIEWGFFKKTTELLPSTNSQTQVARRRIIPLPLEDGVENTESVVVTNNSSNLYSYNLPTSASVSLTAPVSMLDGDIDYTLNIAPYDPNSEYNIVYIVDTSASMDAGELQTVKNAYTDLINSHIDSGLTQNSNFGVVQFSTNATSYFNLTPEEAISTIEGLSTSTNQGTVYDGGLIEGLDFLAQSHIDVFNANNIVYFVSGDISNKVSYFPTFFGPAIRQNDYNSYFDEAERLRNFAEVKAFGFDNASPLQIDDVDSDDGVMVGSVGDLSTELQKSGLVAEVESVKILLDGEVINTLTPDQFTNNSAGLFYEGTVEGLDVSIDAENIITAEVVFTPESNLATTTLDYTVTAGEGQAVDGDGNDIAQSGDGDEDPFERMLDGGDRDDEITLGYADLGANGGAGGDEIIGNRRDNVLDGGAGNDTISAYGGDDTITTGAGTDKVNGGEGIDTAVYNDVAYGNGSAVSLRKVANSVSYNNTDTLTDVEFIQFSDVRVSAETLEVTPVVEVGELSVTEGNSGNTIARFDLNLDTPAPIDITFEYSTEDLDAVAGEDYVAKSGEIVILAGETTATIDLEIIGDPDYEAVELFSLNLSALTGATFDNNRIDYSVPIAIENDDILPLRVNAGKDDVYTDSLDKQWSGNDGFSGGRSYANSNAIAQTDNDLLYQSEYLGENFFYSQDVINGSYDVTLHFAEIYFNGAGRRVFDVSCRKPVSLR